MSTSLMGLTVAVTRETAGQYHCDNGLSIRRRYPVTTDGRVTWAVYATCDARRQTLKRFATLADAKAWVTA